MTEFLNSKIAFRVLIGVGLIALIAGTFAAGVSVGERKSRHFSAWTESYGKSFGGPQRDRRGGRPPFEPMLPGGHGVFGQVLSASSGTMVVQGKDDVEQSVLVTSSTKIRIGRDEGKLEDIQPEMEAAVFGAPNGEGQIEAQLIRIMPKR